MLELAEDLHNKIVSLSQEGDALANAQNYDGAIEKYSEAWSLIPDPPSEWEASTWLLAAIADSYFLGGYFTSGAEALRYALVCPTGAENPFINLRLGQCEFERGEFEQAAEYLLRAYMIEGLEIFANENAKYFDFLKTRIQRPASGKW